MSSIVIFGSARSVGHTSKVLDTVLGENTIPIVDLNTLNIAPYDYEYRNQSDDFIPLIERILSYDTLLLATPVYWYSMSTIMKIFLDRISDVLNLRKDLGRQLRGKQLFVIASFNTSYPRGFEDTFEQICEYLGMHYLGTSFVYSGTENLEFLNNNIAQIEKAQKILQLTSEA